MGKNAHTPTFEKGGKQKFKEHIMVAKGGDLGGSKQRHSFRMTGRKELSTQKSIKLGGEKN